MIKPKIGLMQSRLSPRSKDQPYQFFPDCWGEELNKAKHLGFQYMEMVFDTQADHPLNNWDGVKYIKSVIDFVGLGFNVICADYFMTNKLYEKDLFKRVKTVGILEELIEKSHRIGCRKIVIPCVEYAEPQGEFEYTLLRDSLKAVLNFALTSDIILCLEMESYPEEIKLFMQKINHPNCQLTYDSGNSAGKGYKPNVEFEAYGKWVSHVHIKDKKIYDCSVPYRTGHTDFDTIYQNLIKYNYSGDLTLQLARNLIEYNQREHIEKELIVFHQDYINNFMKE